MTQFSQTKHPLGPSHTHTNLLAHTLGGWGDSLSSPSIPGPPDWAKLMRLCLSDFLLKGDGEGKAHVRPCPAPRMNEWGGGQKKGQNVIAHLCLGHLLLPGTLGGGHFMMLTTLARPWGSEAMGTALKALIRQGIRPPPLGACPACFICPHTPFWECSLG